MPLFAEEVEEVVLEDEVVLNEGSELNEEAEESPYYNLCFSAYLWEVSRR
jgi:putative salt-induced outer membrane protein